MYVVRESRRLLSVHAPCMIVVVVVSWVYLNGAVFFCAV